MTDTDEAQRVVTRLSEPQRRAIIEAREMYRGEWIVGPLVKRRTLDALYGRGMLAISPVLRCGGLTERGLVVRRILQGQP